MPCVHSRDMLQSQYDPGILRRSDWPHCMPGLYRHTSGGQVTPNSLHKMQHLAQRLSQPYAETSFTISCCSDSKTRGKGEREPEVRGRPMSTFMRCHVPTTREGALVARTEKIGPAAMTRSSWHGPYVLKSDSGKRAWFAFSLVSMRVAEKNTFNQIYWIHKNLKSSAKPVKFESTGMAIKMKSTSELDWRAKYWVYKR